ncbi:MAG: DNA adenine methylase [Armatimonadota bacterium]|nr:DNA adenine methylase [Armatimonadota bacterium]
MRQWLNFQPTKPANFIEPFAGGGIISLTVAFEQLASRATMVEFDPEVAAVWETILNGKGEWLADRLVNFDLTRESVAAELQKLPTTKHELGFRTLLRNRVNHGGILAPGAAPIRHGENGKGIQSRWYPTTLRKRILEIISIKDRINFIHGDGIDYLMKCARQPDVVYFIDPPYTAAGKKAGSRLYTHFELDHNLLFELASILKGDFLMTYDNAEGVQTLAQRHGFDTHPIAMKNTHHTEMTELLIGRNLDWARAR